MVYELRNNVQEQNSLALQQYQRPEMSLVEELGTVTAEIQDLRL